MNAKTLSKNEFSPIPEAQEYLSTKRPFEALKVVNTLLQEEPENWSAHFNRGIILEWLGQFEEALKAFSQAKANGAGAKLVKDAKKRVDSVVEMTEEAKVALNDGRSEQALAILKEAHELRSSSVVDLLLVRAKLDVGETASAMVMVDAFLDERPQHSLAQRLKRAIQDAIDDDLSERKKSRSSKKGKAAADRKPAAGKAASTKKRRIIKTEDDRKFEGRLTERVAQLEAALPDDSAEVRKHIRWIKANASKIKKTDWANEPDFAKAAHFLFAKNIASAIENYDAHLISKSVEFGYITWPKRIQQYIKGAKVLDVGCGFGAFGNGFLLAGAKEYVGIDPQMPLDSERVKNKRKRQWTDLGITPREIMTKCPAIKLVNGIFEDLDRDDKFDAVALHNVTEHLERIRDIIPEIRQLLSKDGYLIYHHDNFYSWNGHHLAPSRPENYQPGTGNQDMMADWNHIVIADDMPEDHYFNTNLNRIRLDEMKAVTEKYYDIVTWLEMKSLPPVLERLTDKVWEKLHSFDPTLSKRDLLVSTVLCVAKPK